MKEPILLDSFGEVVVKGYHWFDEDITPQAKLVISHGMMETIDRYHDFAVFLVAQGISVYGHSHRGHGQTAGSPDALGDLGKDGWMKARNDLRQTLMRAQADDPDTPVFLLGHSMGSFLVRDLMAQLHQERAAMKDGRTPSQENGSQLKGIILSGTGLYNAWILRLGKWLAGMEMKRHGPLHRSKRLHRMSMGSYNNKIQHPQSFFDWLSRDREMVRRYDEDPYCGQVHTSRYYHDFFHNLHRILHEDDLPEPASVKETDERQQKESAPPLFLIGGEEDPVGDYGVGVEKTEHYYRKRGYPTTCKLYPGARHELLNEINRQEVYRDIADWIINHTDH
ncbi:MAG: alpha/beta fold hydrolase [Bacillota bacterium]|nr:alpha/beta fold hydrolase [Bacillota bacterium]MDW7678490.1 alpha/beta fold hydrolase [Bacillota bacterium]